jgi:hypothetical protein
MAQMITPIAAAMSSATIETPKLRSLGSPKRRTTTALTNDKGTTTTATITHSCAAFSL